MKFWDSSALIPLFVGQPSSTPMRALFEEDTDVLVWILTDVEVWSALGRLRRDGAMSAAQAQDAAVLVESFWKMVRVVSAIDAVKVRARRLLNTHQLRAADSLQLAAGLTATHDLPFGHAFVCLHQRLADAARAEGFKVLP